MKASLSFLQNVSRETAFKVGDALSNLAYNLPRIKRVTETNLRFTGHPTSIGIKSLQNFVRCSIDFFRSLKYPFEELSSLIEECPLEKIPPGGGILLTAHIGNWELMGAFFSVKSGGKLSVVAKPMKNEKVNALINNIRQKWGIKVIPTGNVIEMVKDLKRGKYLGILLDQRPKVKEGILTEFLGRKAYTNKGAAVLSIKTKKPVIPAFCFITKDFNYRVEIGNPIYPENKSVEELTILYTKEIEKAVKKHPEQWFWFHNRWKNSPEFKEFLKTPP